MTISYFKTPGGQWKLFISVKDQVIIDNQLYRRFEDGAAEIKSIVLANL